MPSRTPLHVLYANAAAQQAAYDRDHNRLKLNIAVNLQQQADARVAELQLPAIPAPKAPPAPSST